MEEYRKKYERVFQQLYQYDVFAVSTDKNTVKKTTCKYWEVQELLSEICQKYINLFSQV